MSAKFILWMPPFGKARPRVERGRGRNPTRYSRWLHDAVLQLRHDMSSMKGEGHTFPLEGPVELDVLLVKSRPKHMHAAKYEDGLLMCPVTPDIDNAVGSLMDAATKAGIYPDDSKVTDLYVAKRYAERGGNERVEFTVRVLKEG
jgi:Holliday junction resolvase RusA-like endonuclease